MFVDFQKIFFNRLFCWDDSCQSGPADLEIFLLKAYGCLKEQLNGISFSEWFLIVKIYILKNIPIIISAVLIPIKPPYFEAHTSINF